MDQEIKNCIIHNTLIPLSNFIQLKQWNLTKLLNVKTAGFKEPAGSSQRIIASKCSMLSEIYGKKNCLFCTWEAEKSKIVQKWMN